MLQNLQSVISWARGPLVVPNLISGKASNSDRCAAQLLEKKWGNEMINQTDNGQWTTKLGEQLVKEVLENKGETVIRPISKNGYRPDWETKSHIVEVKTRCWTCPGTAGEKILGVPWKYSDIPKLYGKPLMIICVGYQEWEAKNKFNLLDSLETISDERLNMLNYWKSIGISYVPFTSLI
tara:strand:+ start:654 stop:1193 length:540 start_codon:yes stop_codon:yes gene_type:complete